jgi:hypothetical protein
MYVRLQVQNTSTSARPASAVYVGFGAELRSALDDWPRPGWRTLQLFNPDDTGGTRYLAPPKTQGPPGGRAPTWWVTSWPTARSAVRWHREGCHRADGPDARRRRAAYDHPGVRRLARRRRFDRRGWYPLRALLPRLVGRTRGHLGFAIDNVSAAFAGSASFDQRLREVSTDSGAQYGATHTFRGCRHANWWCAGPVPRARGCVQLPLHGGRRLRLPHLPDPVRGHGSPSWSWTSGAIATRSTRTATSS